MKRIILIVLVLCGSVSGGSVFGDSGSLYGGSSGISVGETPARIQPPAINNYPHAIPMLFDTASAWEASEITPSDITDHVIASDTGNQVKYTIKAGVGTAAIDTFDDVSNLDFSGKTKSLVIDWYLYPGTGASDPDKLETIALTLFSSVNYPTDISTAVFFQRDATRDTVTGWHRTIITPNRWVDGGGGTPDLTSVQRVRLRCGITEADATPSFLIGKLSVMENLAKPYVIYTFDDATVDQIPAANSLSINQIPGTFYTIEEQIGNPTFMTLDQVKDIQQAGHLIANHTSMGAPGVEWSDWTKAQRRQYTVEMREWMFNNGFARGADLLATPGGWVFQYDDGVEDIISIIRSTTNPYTGNFDPNHPATLPYIHVSASWSVADEDASIISCDAAVDLAITHNQIAVIMVHGVTDIAKFKTHIDATKVHIDASQITAIDMADLLTEF